MGMHGIGYVLAAPLRQKKTLFLMPPSKKISVLPLNVPLLNLMPLPLKIRKSVFEIRITVDKKTMKWQRRKFSGTFDFQIKKKTSKALYCNNLFDLWFFVIIRYSNMVFQNRKFSNIYRFAAPFSKS